MVMEGPYEAATSLHGKEDNVHAVHPLLSLLLAYFTAASCHVDTKIKLAKLSMSGDVFEK